MYKGSYGFEKPYETYTFKLIVTFEDSVTLRNLRVFCFPGQLFAGHCSAH